MSSHYFGIIAVSSGSFGAAVPINLTSDPEHLMLYNKHATAIVEF